MSVAPASRGPNSSHTESTKHGDVFSATTSSAGSSGYERCIQAHRLRIPVQAFQQCCEQERNLHLHNTAA